MIRHSFILWDCSFRSFFHTLHSLVDQEFARTDYEIIVVEQRTKDHSDRFNHDQELPSLNDEIERCAESASVRAVYLGEPAETPFHLGVVANQGLREAAGEFVSVMDADLLLKKTFIRRLDDYCRNHPESIVNLFRHMADRPVGVAPARWKKQEIGFETCLDVCPTKGSLVPDRVGNKGPLICARAEAWRETGGYDEHRIWSTGVTRLGFDVTTRLEIFAERESAALPNTFAVHPWHPIGFTRSRLRHARVFELHNRLIDWAKKNRESDWRERLSFTDNLYVTHRQLVDAVATDLGRPGDTDSLRQPQAFGGTNSWHRLLLHAESFVTKLYRGYWRLLRSRGFGHRSL